MQDVYRWLVVGTLFLCGVTGVQAQGTFGSPYIKNITPEEYRGHLQNWDATQHSSGMLYIANLGGVLEYDGVGWRMIDIPNVTALSVNVYNDTVFVGGVNEMGYLFHPDDDSAATRYRSLREEIDELPDDFGDVWQVLSAGDGIYFRTPNYLFKYKDGSLEQWQSETGFHFAFNVKDQIYVNIREEGLHRVVGNDLQLLPYGEEFAEDGIYAMLPYPDGRILMATRYKNLVVYDGSRIQPFSTPANAFIEDNRLYNGLALSDGSYVFGTLKGGMVRIDSDGAVLNIINKENGLLDDVIYSLYEDRELNLWVLQKDGISITQLLSPVTIFDERQGLKGMPRSMLQQDDFYYVGTRDGIFRRSKEGEKQGFTHYAELDKAPKDFLTIDDQLFFISSDGVWEVRDEKLTHHLDFMYGNVLFHSKHNPALVFAGTRDGILLLRWQGKEWQEIGKIEGIKSEITTIAEDTLGNVWAGARSGGIYQLQWQSKNLLRPEITHWATDKERAQVFGSGNEVIFGFQNTTMRYDIDTDSLVENSQIEVDELQNENPGLFLMTKDLKQNYWVRYGNHNLKMRRDEDGAFTQQPSYLNLIQSNQYNFIYPDDEGQVWFGTDQGLMRYDDTVAYQSPPGYNAFVREVLVHNDSLIYRGPRKGGNDITLNFDENEVRFRYAAPTFTRAGDTEYQVYLEGFDPDWSSWTSEVNKDYTNISEGHYTFKVRARNIHHEISEAGTFSFRVLPPWYRTFWAYGLYLVVIAGVLYGAHRLRVNRILREQRIRNRIASDLHDEVSATLSSITYFAQAIRQSKNGQKEERFVGLISESANEAKEKISDIIWSIDPEQDDWISLFSKCRRFASDLFESKGMDYELDIATDIDRSLDIEIRQHLWLIFKEMVVNAARHSQAKRVDVFFGQRNNALELVVQDNGIGLPNDGESGKGHGIKNIKKRAQQLGAELTLDTDHKIGTRWSMRLQA